MGLSWQQVRAALRNVDPLPPISLPLAAALGGILARPLVAPTDVPVADAAAADGWAVAGQGPWAVVSAERLADQQAAVVRQGDTLPPGASAVVVRGCTDVAAGRTRLQVAGADGQPAAHPGLVHYGSGVLPRGAHAAAGEVLLTAGAAVTPAVIGLAAAAGCDDLMVIPPPTVGVEIASQGYALRGPLRPGRRRDVVAELLPAWLDSIGARRTDRNADVTVIVSDAPPPTGRPLIDGVCYQQDDRYLVLLPRAPREAAIRLALVLHPLLAALGARPLRELTALLDADLYEAPAPAVLEQSDLVLRVRALRWRGPGGLADLAAADAMVVEPGRAGSFVPVLALRR